MKIIPGSRRRYYAARVGIFLVTAALIAGMAGCPPIPPPSQDLEIQDWYDLDAIRDNLSGNYTLMNDLDSTTPGYTELVSPTANGGKGWQPIGPSGNPFTGTFDGQGYEIHDLFINRLNHPQEIGVGLFGYVGEGGVIKDIGVVDATVTGYGYIGSLVGENRGTVSNSYATGNVTGDDIVGGLVGQNHGTVSNSYSNGSVSGDDIVGGLVGINEGTVSDSYSTGNVNGSEFIGGLVGGNRGEVSDSYSTGSVYGSDYVGGLVGGNTYSGTVSNSYSTSSVTGDGAYYVGGLVGYNEYGTVSYSYATGNVTGDDIVGGLVGINVAGTVSDSYSTGSVYGSDYVGGLVGGNRGEVSNSYSTGSVYGNSSVGGLVGRNFDTITNSYSTGSVYGNSSVGGLVGDNEYGTVSYSFWDTQTSGQATSDGGTGKNTTEMQYIATFSGAGWNITAVTNPGTRNPSYIWNIVHNVTYPFLSWES